MKPITSLIPIVLFSLITPATAAISIDSGSWSRFGGAVLSGQTSTGLNWGSGAANNADNSFLIATLDGDTATAGNQNVVLNAGETLHFTGTIDLSGTQPLTTGSLQFRFGLFNTNSSPTNGFGWLGYFAGNGTLTNNGGLYAKNTGNTDGYIVEAGATQLTSFSGQGAVLTDGLYSFSLSLQRTATSVFISSTLIRQSDSASFVSVSGFEHTGGTAPVLSDFNRIGFLAGDGLDADRVVLSNVNLAIVPEPSSALLACAAAGLLSFRRRR